jgi:hypothetical protein
LEHLPGKYPGTGSFFRELFKQDKTEKLGCLVFLTQVSYKGLTLIALFFWFSDSNFL